MKNQQFNYKKNIFLYFLVVTVMSLIGYLGIFFFFLSLDDMENRKVIGLRQEWINVNKNKILYIYTHIFPKAKDCKTFECEETIRNLIDKNHDSSLPIFFIKLKDESTIEKLYQGGGYKEELIDSKEEKMVAQMLEGTRNPFNYPQYNCCGGDDIVLEIPILSAFLPTRIYLKDFYSEIEHIFIIKDDQEKIVGGLVYLYGD